MALEEAERELKRVEHPDGRIVQVVLEAGRAIVIFHDWQERAWRFEFAGVVLLRAYEYSGDIETVRVSDDADTIDEAMDAIERDGGNCEGYPGLLAVEFVVEMPVLTVVFKTLHIVGLEKEQEDGAFIGCYATRGSGFGVRLRCSSGRSGTGAAARPDACECDACKGGGAGLQ